MVWNNDDDSEIIFSRQLNWGRVAIVAGLVLMLAVLVMVLVSTADFGDGDRSTVPSSPGSCQPFCPQPTP
ncbi:hypothetical protein [Nocardia sp. NPDC052566]|uniref:hypothetical protein n=1 Tax=Nocardia sp. NPDC052566 TaxID=3364330 RepID=UPI0037CCB411